MDRKLILLTLAVLLALAGGLAHVSARRPASSGAPPSAFTYQGRLNAGGAPASGPYTLTFRLYGAASGGAPLGSQTTTVSVTNGLFTALLDFGTAAFDGTPRWLELEVGGATLAPRQALTATPYALHASAAPWSGLRDVPADLADGDQVGLTSVGWSDVLTRPAGLDDGDQVGLTSVGWSDVLTRPPGLDDGDDDTTYVAGPGLALNGAQFRAQGSPISNTIIVAKGGGDFASVQAALNSITTASASNPYLVYVAPGVYTEQVTLKPYVTLEGAGPSATIIRWTGGDQRPADGDGSATIVGADNATLRQLAVESGGAGLRYAIGLINRGGSPSLSDLSVSAGGAITTAYGIYNSGGSPTLSDLSVAVSASSASYGIYNSGSAAALTNLRVSASDASNIYGVYNSGGAPTLSSVEASAAGGTANIGIYNTNSSLAVLSNVTARAVGSGSSFNYGIYNTSSVTLNHVTASAAGGNTSYGVFNDGASPALSDVTSGATGGAINFGVFNNNASTTIRGSAITGSSLSVHHSGSGTVKVADSQLSGPLSSGLACFDNYTENFVALTCP